MKEKIIAQLKAMLLTLGVKNLSNARIDAIADKLASKITDEATIDARLTELNEVLPLAEIAKQDDQVRTLQAANKPKPDPTKPDDKQPVDEPAVPDDTPGWAKKLIDDNKKLTDRLEQIEAGKAKDSNHKKLIDALKEKDIPDTYYGMVIDGREFKTPEEVDAFVEKVATAYASFSGTTDTGGRKETGLGKHPKPTVAKGAGGKKDEASKEEIDSVMSTIM